LQHKKAVLCEKPFAMNAQEVAEMIAAAKQNNTLLMEALWTYFLPHFKIVLEFVENKKYGTLKKLEADFGFHTPYNTDNRLFKKEVGGGSLLDIGIYPIFAALSTLGKPSNIEAKATFFENGADSSCSMIFDYADAKTYLKSTLKEETPTEAIFTFEEAVVKIHKRFQEPSRISIISKGIEKTIDSKATTIGYNYEAEHFSQLIRDGKKQSDIMTFAFSENLIATLDEVRAIIGLEY
jgi:predicted dehydrogenase